MKAIKVLGAASLLALGAAFAAPIDETAPVGQLVQVVEALPQALASADLSVDQAKALKSVISEVSGDTLTPQQAKDALSQIQAVLSSDEYNEVLQAANYEPQVILPSSDSNPLSANGGDGVQYATLDANNFLSAVITADSPIADRDQ